ncbi:MAG: carboxypeptidase regulatory-like domain-containing protein [Oscillospiraceae bacterium]|nr:carboxypeptidase regulatory-like domain-containing protein [Oscillospiraceae bacterium]
MTAGTILVAVTTSDAQIPIEDAEITIEQSAQPDYRTLTDESGLTLPFAVAAPPASESKNPGTPTPYSTVTVTVRRDGYETERRTGVQIFPGTQTRQRISLMPVLPTMPDQIESEATPPQNL